MEFTVETRALEHLAATGARGEMPPGSIRSLEKLGQQFQRHIVGDLLANNILQRRTGQGQRSIFYRVEVQPDGKTLALTIGADLAKAPYMRAHNHGGTIRPTHGQYLTIPLKDARTGNGVARFTAREVISNPQAFGYVATFFRRGGSGFASSLFLFGQKYRKTTIEGQRVEVDTGGKIVPLFVLKESITLPARPWLDIAIVNMQEPMRAAGVEAAEAIVAALTGLPAGSGS